MEDQPLSLLLDNIHRESAAKESENGSQRPTAVVRERRLRVGSHRVTDISDPSQSSSPVVSTFNDVAAEFFLCPLINRFWLFLRDEQTREERTSHLQGRQRYHGTGTGLVLNPIILTHFLRALAILTHASRNALEWVTVISPSALEIAVTLGTKPVSLIEVTETYRHDENQGKEASVLTAALELALVVLDGSLELDDGRLLCLEHSALLLGTGEWAGKVFSQMEGGHKVRGAGAQEAKLQRAVTAVLLRVEEMTSKWRRSIMRTW